VSEEYGGMMRVRLKLGALELHVDARWDLGPTELYDQEQDEPVVVPAAEPEKPSVFAEPVEDIEATQEFHVEDIGDVERVEDSKVARQAKLDKERSLWQRDTP
jgi:hypothetical protein